jgi:hypothetical protein
MTRSFSVLSPIAGLLMLVYLLLAGCQETTPTPAAPTPTAALAAVASVTPTLTPALSDVSAVHRPLTVWLPASLVPTPESPAAEVLEEAVAQFTANYPELPVDILPKADEGPASLLNYLRSGQQVAPSILPDLVLLETQQLWQAAELGLVQPLTLTQLAFQDFYPFASESVIINNRTYGAPYFADLIHLVYNPEAVPTPPTTWADLVALNQPFAFPGAGRGGSADDWLILQYLESRTPAESNAGIDRVALRALLTRSWSPAGAGRHLGYIKRSLVGTECRHSGVGQRARSSLSKSTPGQRLGGCPLTDGCSRTPVARPCLRLCGAHRRCEPAHPGIGTH